MNTILMNKSKEKLNNNNNNNNKNLCLNIISNRIQLDPLYKNSASQTHKERTKSGKERGKEFNIFKLITDIKLDLKEIKKNNLDNLSSHDERIEWFEKKKIVRKYKPINDYFTRSRGLHNILDAYLQSDDSSNESTNKKNRNQDLLHSNDANSVKNKRNKIFVMKLCNDKNANTKLQEGNVNIQPNRNTFIRFINDKLPQKELNVIRRCFEKSTCITSRTNPQFFKNNTNATRSLLDIKELNMKKINNDDNSNQFDNNNSQPMLSLSKYMKYNLTPCANLTSLTKSIKKKDESILQCYINDSNINTDSISYYTKSHQKNFNIKYKSTDLEFHSNPFIQIDSNPKRQQINSKKLNNDEKQKLMRLHHSEILLNGDYVNKSLPKIQKRISINTMLRSNNKQSKTLYVGSLSHSKHPLKIYLEVNQGDNLNKNCNKEKKQNNITHLQFRKATTVAPSKDFRLFNYSKTCKKIKIGA